MLKIATHNSFTGEKPYGLASCLGALFSKCQSKNLRQQYQAGCRLFDLRINKCKGQWRGAHGLWHSKRTFYDMLKQLETYNCYAILTYEGSSEDKDFQEFLQLTQKVKECSIHWVYFAVKKPIWNTFEVIDSTISIRQGFQVLGEDWHSLIPIPYIWRNTNCKEFNEEVYTLVDFL